MDLSMNVRNIRRQALEGKFAGPMKVYYERTKNSQDVEIHLKFLKVLSSLDRNPTEMRLAVVYDSLSKYSSSENLWYKIAFMELEGDDMRSKEKSKTILSTESRIQRAMSVFETALIKVNTPLMWTMFISIAKRIYYRFPLKDKNYVRNIVYDAFQKAHNHGILKELDYLSWLDITRDWSDRPHLRLYVFKFSIAKLGTSIILWEELLKHSLQTENNEALSMVLLNIAIGKLQDKSFSLWTIFLEHYKGNAEKMSELFLAGIQTKFKYSKVLRILYKEWRYDQTRKTLPVSNEQIQPNNVPAEETGQGKKKTSPVNNEQIQPNNNEPTKETGQGNKKTSPVSNEQIQPNNVPTKKTGQGKKKISPVSNEQIQPNNNEPMKETGQDNKMTSPVSNEQIQPNNNEPMEETGQEKKKERNKRDGRVSWREISSLYIDGFSDIHLEIGGRKRRKVVNGENESSKEVILSLRISEMKKVNDRKKKAKVGQIKNEILSEEILPLSTNEMKKGTTSGKNTKKGKSENGIPSEEILPLSTNEMRKGTSRGKCTNKSKHEKGISSLRLSELVNEKIRGQRTNRSKNGISSEGGFPRRVSFTEIFDEAVMKRVLKTNGSKKGKSSEGLFSPRPSLSDLSEDAARVLNSNGDPSEWGFPRSRSICEKKEETGYGKKTKGGKSKNGIWIDADQGNVGTTTKVQDISRGIKRKLS